jgi:poly(hydroxyalkanoate) granule-associated protein
MAKDKKKKDKKVSVGLDSDALEKIEDSAHKIWLAGLGAFSKAEQEGEKLFESLVKQGVSVEEHYRDYLVGTVKKAASTTTSTIEFMEQMFEKRMAEAIARVPAPAADSMGAVVKQMNDLRRSILGIMGVSTKASEKSQPAPAVAKKKVVRKKVVKKAVAKKPVARKAVAKKAVARKTTARKAVAKKTTARKTIAKKAAPKKTVAKKTTDNSGTPAAS